MPILEINNLIIDFETDQGVVEAIDHLTLSVREGEILGVVGESGCGKTTIARSIMGVVPQPPARLRNGEIRFQGEDLLRMSEAALTARIRGKAVTVIPQDPLASLNPLFPIGVQLRDLLQWSRKSGTAGGATASHVRIIDLLRAVQLPSPEAQLRKYPHEFSGGQRQRIGIARALAVEPRLIVCDEPVSALDVSVQAQVINLLQDLQKERQLALLFISHDLAVVEHLCARIAVMYLGRIVEWGSARELCRAPRHPYTQALLSAVPIVDPDSKRQRIVLGGDVPSPIDPPPGCPFHPRCPIAEARCRSEVPALRPCGERLVACHLAA